MADAPLQDRTAIVTGAASIVGLDIAGRAGRVDMLAAIAGIQAFKPLMEMHDADWHDQIDVNLTGIVTMIRIVAPRMTRQGGA